MNDDARENGSVTGKALGNLAIAGASILAGGVGIHLTAKALGGVSNGIKKGATKAKDVVGKMYDKYANVDPLKNDVDAKYVRNILTDGDPKKILNKNINEQAKDYSVHLNAQNKENVANMGAMEDLTSILSPDGEVSAFQTSMLESNSDGTIGRVADEIKLNNKNGAGSSKPIVNEPPVAEEVSGQFSMLDDGYVSHVKEMDNYIANKKKKESAGDTPITLSGPTVGPSPEEMNSILGNYNVLNNIPTAPQGPTFKQSSNTPPVNGPTIENAKNLPPITTSGTVQGPSPEQMNEILGAYSLVNNHQQTNFGPTIENAKNLPPINGPTINNASGLPNGGGSNMNQQFINISSSQGQPRTSSVNTGKNRSGGYEGMNLKFRNKKQANRAEKKYLK